MDEAAGHPDNVGDELVERGGVKIAGENPMIVLYRSGTDEPVAIASVWTSVYSEAGTGHALVIWVDADQSSSGTFAPSGIYTDNPELASFVWQNFYNDYTLIHGRGIEDAPPHTAHFVVESEVPQWYRISSTAGPTTIVLEWRDVVEVFQTTVYPKGYDVSLVALPCASGTITVNGVAVQGETHQPEGWFKSSAFLAFAETWIAREND